MCIHWLHQKICVCNEDHFWQCRKFCLVFFGLRGIWLFKVVNANIAVRWNHFFFLGVLKSYNSMLLTLWVNQMRAVVLSWVCLRLYSQQTLSYWLGIGIFQPAIWERTNCSPQATSNKLSELVVEHDIVWPIQTRIWVSEDCILV